jgi:enamine deaminase RidA (YjgF/YER057c/UK114 family)
VTDIRRALLTRVNPPALGQPSGFNHGLLAPLESRLLLIAGQTAADANGQVRQTTFATQFDEALGRVLAVVAAAGGLPQHLGRMTVFVTDLDAYRAARPELREVWKRRIGAHYPAMSVVEVTRLVDAGATVEIEATALLPFQE